MKYIEKLLKGAEVQWMPLGEVAEIYGGLTGKSKADFEDGNALFVSYKNIYDNYEIDVHNLARVKVSDDERQNKIEYGDILFTGSSETAEDVAFSSAVTSVLKEPVYLNSFSFGIRFNKGVEMMPEFSKHLFRGSVMRKQLKLTASGVTRFNVSKARFKRVLVPIPPLRLQEEIVRILDKFTTLEAELEAELDCRKRQYEYYRNQLLSFDVLDGETQSPQNVTWLTIEDISNNISSGGTPRSNIAAYYGGNIPWLRTQEVNFSEIWDTEIKITEEGMNSSSAKYIPANCVIVAMYGATVGRVGINKIPLTTNQACANIEVDDSIAFYKYVYYYLSSQYKYIKSLGTGSQTNINAGIVRKLKIPIPPLAEQQRIVSILDKFETLTTSISEGLPKEIALRRKQYEYYRNQLLSFA